MVNFFKDSPVQGLSQKLMALSEVREVNLALLDNDLRVEVVGGKEEEVREVVAQAKAQDSAFIITLKHRPVGLWYRLKTFFWLLVTSIQLTWPLWVVVALFVAGFVGLHRWGFQ